MYCKDAKVSPVGNKIVCGNSQTSVSDQAQSLCPHRDCELNKKKGVWICCMCRFGYTGSDRNRYGMCSGCAHRVCEDCKAWNKENVAEMEAEDAAEEDSDDTNGSPIPDPRGGTDDDDDADDAEEDDAEEED
jgi:hypothetical protein